MPFQIDDQQLSVGVLAETDALGLAADDTITDAEWTSVDTTDAGTDVTVSAGDSSSGTSDGDLTKVTVQATGTGVGSVAITGTITFASGAVLLFTDSGSVNGGPAASVGATWGPATAIPAPAAS
jgi:hypothetical protein